jgi:acetyl esterase/lipase
MNRPYEVHIYHNLEYARVGEKALLLDLYLPEEPAGALPVVIWVHGGAWRQGNKEYPPTERLTAGGFAVASISYRLSQEAIFPAQIHDCKAAVRWLRAHAARYRLDPERFGAWGSSAGGHLVALLGASGGVAELEGTVGGNLEHSSRVQAVCDYFGPTDFLQQIGQPGDIDRSLPDAPEAQLVGGPLRERQGVVRQANPITYVSPDNPPFLLLQGDCDRSVPLNQSVLLHEALTAAGVPSTLHVIEGAGHGFDSPEIDAEVDAFFDRHLKRKP